MNNQRVDGEGLFAAYYISQTMLILVSASGTNTSRIHIPVLRSFTDTLSPASKTLLRISNQYSTTKVQAMRWDAETIYDTIYSWHIKNMMTTQVRKALEERQQGENTAVGIATLQEVAGGLKRLGVEIRKAVRNQHVGRFCSSDYHTPNHR